MTHKRPHTNFRSGTPVFVHMRDGTSFRDVFVENLGRWVQLRERGKLRVIEVRAMSIYRIPPHERASA